MCKCGHGRPGRRRVASAIYNESGHRCYSSKINIKRRLQSLRGQDRVNPPRRSPPPAAAAPRSCCRLAGVESWRSSDRRRDGEIFEARESGSQ
ncbi:hypothetical protein EVAR_64673_1 [Eumeta japonica]|uniref:Uncharacterized protein n=1 Tax=Eumeta variegata TaxID=151549 RepID=A0A4C1ZUV5_EUMVA|nr:hypothetical protein EVAR_64673_1 [Eumeta japonica]